jgi:hypothetical protein
MNRDSRNHSIAMNGPGTLPSDYFEKDDETLTIREALQNIVDSAQLSPGKKYYLLDLIDFDNAVASLKRGV